MRGRGGHTDYDRPPNPFLYHNAPPRPPFLPPHGRFAPPPPFGPPHFAPGPWRAPPPFVRPPAHGFQPPFNRGRGRGNTGQGGHGGRGRAGGKRDSFPQDKPFFCHACFVGCDTQELFDKHKADHVDCSVDGCQFSGIAKALAKHAKNAHKYARAAGSSGAGGSNRPDAAWLEQRKRRYPTDEARSRRQEASAAAVHRGDVLVPAEAKLRCRTGSHVVTHVAPAGGAHCSAATDALAKPPIGTSATFLEKLLHNEIKHERNVLLQCIRHVVTRNYYLSG